MKWTNAREANAQPSSLPSTAHIEPLLGALPDDVERAHASLRAQGATEDELSSWSREGRIGVCDGRVILRIRHWLGELDRAGGWESVGEPSGHMAPFHNRWHDAATGIALLRSEHGPEEYAEDQLLRVSAARAAEASRAKRHESESEFRNAEGSRLERFQADRAARWRAMSEMEKSIALVMARPDVDELSTRGLLAALLAASTASEQTHRDMPDRVADALGVKFERRPQPNFNAQRVVA